MSFSGTGIALIVMGAMTVYQQRLKIPPNPPLAKGGKPWRVRMRERIGVVGRNEDASRALCRTLERYEYRTTLLRSMPELEASVLKRDFQVVILDLDSVPVNNRFLRDLRKLNPQVHVIGLSSRTFHPDLQDAMRNDISACLGKPIDVDELIYWLKSICEAN
jgi:DNA-binding NtrC family response regulator